MIFINPEIHEERKNSFPQILLDVTASEPHVRRGDPGIEYPVLTVHLVVVYQSQEFKPYFNIRLLFRFPTMTSICHIVMRKQCHAEIVNKCVHYAFPTFLKRHVWKTKYTALHVSQFVQCIDKLQDYGEEQCLLCNRRGKYMRSAEKRFSN
ncbi:unnamed protein product [Brugia pahangi]|uniref:Uncharacterized protein n=1 Tax=Brugia pahangi TaxID=6280 RepID=A0A0N4SYA8_BRUPA|nr:unnamed protein product [Brugia pahangi]